MRCAAGVKNLSKKKKYFRKGMKGMIALCMALVAASQGMPEGVDMASMMGGAGGAGGMDPAAMASMMGGAGM